MSSLNNNLNGSKTRTQTDHRRKYSAKLNLTMTTKKENKVGFNCSPLKRSIAIPIEASQDRANMLRVSLVATTKVASVGRIHKPPACLFQGAQRFKSTSAEDHNVAPNVAWRKEESDVNPKGKQDSEVPSSKASPRFMLDKFFSDRKNTAEPAQRTKAETSRQEADRQSNNNNSRHGQDSRGGLPNANNQNRQQLEKPRQQLRQAIDKVSGNGYNNMNAQNPARGGQQQQNQNQNQQRGSNGSNALRRPNHQQQQQQNPRGGPQVEGLFLRPQQQQQSNGSNNNSNNRGANQSSVFGDRRQQQPNPPQNRDGSVRSNQPRQQQQPQHNQSRQNQQQQNFDRSQGQGKDGQRQHPNKGQGRNQQQQQHNQVQGKGFSKSNLFQTLRNSVPSDPASPGGRQQQADPIEALRRNFMPNSDRKQPPPAGRRSSAGTTVQKKDMTDVSTLSAALFKMPKPNGRKGVTNGSMQKNPQSKAAAGSADAGGSDKSKFQSPLSEFIRFIQLKHAEEKAKKEPEEDSPLTSAPRTPLPKWRLQTNRLRDVRQQRNDRRNRGAEVPPRFQRAQRERKARPIYVDPRSQMITLPNHEISLTEASLLFRQRGAKLKRVLRKLGELPNEKADSAMLSVDTLELIALEINAKFQRSTRQAVPTDEEKLMQRRSASEETVEAGKASYASLTPRPPVVCIMGHVDHGKTTLMDALRRRSRAAFGGEKEKSKTKKDKKTKKSGKKGSSENKNVAGTEAGGITQVVSAFQVPISEADAVVTFLDTPGHAAFKAMRQSGSDAADIIVLVVAADDGVSEQTIEILNYYKSIVKSSGGGGISLVVAMNKIDKPGIDIDESTFRIQNELYAQGIVTEGLRTSEEGEYGPPVQVVPVSGLTGLGLDELIEGLALQSEIMDLRADDDAPAEGIVLDARVEKGLGVVVDCIIRWGSLEQGDFVVSGTHSGKVRTIKDVNSKTLAKGTPSQPVRIVGFETVPKAGDPIVCVESEEAAEDLVTRRKASAAGNADTSADVSSDAELQSSGKHMMHNEWKSRLEVKYGLDNEVENTAIRIPVIIKADADGTLAAVRDSLIKVGSQSSHNIFIDPILVGVGPVLATDIQMAKESNAGIFCFNVKNEQLIEKLAQEEKVRLLRTDVIYSLLDESKKVFANYLPSIPVEVVHGRAKVKASYDIGGIDTRVAGLSVLTGTLYKAKAKGESGTLSCQFRILRKGKIISPDLRATSLKHFKDDVDKVGRGDECGLSLSAFNDYEVGDEIECFSVDMKKEFI